MLLNCGNERERERKKATGILLHFEPRSGFFFLRGFFPLFFFFFPLFLALPPLDRAAKERRTLGAAAFSREIIGKCSLARASERGNNLSSKYWFISTAISPDFSGAPVIKVCAIAGLKRRFLDVFTHWFCNNVNMLRSLAHKKPFPQDWEKKPFGQRC